MRMALKFQFMLLLLLCGISFFSFFSFPWPKTVQLPEISILFLLIVLIVVLFNGVFLYYKNFENPFFLLYFWLFFQLAFVGLFSNNFIDLIRDFIAYLYLLIPLFIYLNLKGDQKFFFDVTLVTFLIVFALEGLVLSLRSMWPYFLSSNFDIKLVYQSHLMPHRDYLFLAPSILFGSLFFLYYSFKYLKLKKISFSLLLLLVSIVTIMAPFVAVMRIPVFLYLVGFFAFAYLFFRIKGLVIIFVLIVSVASFYLNDVFAIFEALINKQIEVGSNGKLDEFIFIVDFLNSGSILHLFFGTGFGGVYYSPILLTEVRFSHNIFSYFLLKGGLFSFVIVATWYLLIVLKSFQYIYLSFVGKDFLGFGVVVSFIFTFLAATLFQPGYKTLDFSLLLVVFVLFVLKRGVKNAKHDRGSKL